jgi:hypothetical protein
MNRGAPLPRKTPMRRTALRIDDGKARATVAVPRPKRCKACKGLFTPARPMQRACNHVCAMDLAKQAREAEQRKLDKAQRERLKPRSKWMAEAQAAFNRYCRLRDAALPCISCDRFHAGAYDAGHYLSTGARPELRFHEANVHRQCVPCNQHLHGNLVLYRLGLIRRIGLEAVERLEGPHEPRKYSIDELREIRDTYRRRARELEKA